jgi:hypothetical protein
MSSLGIVRAQSSGNAGMRPETQTADAISRGFFCLGVERKGVKALDMSDLYSQHVLSDFLGVVCSGCGHRKPSKMSFCRRCYFKLPDSLRRCLYRRFGEGYEDAFASAKRFLRRQGFRGALSAPGTLFGPSELRRCQ